MSGSSLSTNANILFDSARKAFSAGDLSTAESLCRQLVGLVPKDGRPWSLLSEMALRRRRPDAAIICADKAVELGPRDPFAHLMRAKCLALDGHFRDAVAAAEKGARIADLPPAALDGLGAIFSMLGRHQRALAFFRKAVEAVPGNPQFLFNLAASERMAGDLAAAEAHCDQAIRLDPRFALAHYVRADLRTQTPARNHIGQMEAVLAAGVRSPRDEVMLRFTLGKEYEDLGEDARAFAYIKTGADLYRSHIRYDGKDDIATIDRIIRVQTAAALNDAPRGFGRADPIFVVGLPRSGTTVIERILGSHRALVSAGELGAFSDLVRRRAATPGDPGSAIERALSIDLAALGRAYMETAHENGVPQSRRFIDKTLQNYLHCGIIHAALPNAKIVVVRRHPMDTGFALYKALFEGTFGFSYDLRELGEYYLAFDRLMTHWRATLPADTLIEVAYEDVVADPERESRRLLDFLGLPWDEDVLRFHESRTPATTASAVQVRRPLYNSSVGRWRRHEAELAPLRAALAEGIPEDRLV